MHKNWSGVASCLLEAMSVWGFALNVTACGASRSTSPERVETEDLGAACGDARPVTPSEVSVDDASECGNGVCLYGASVARGASTSTGMCTCRCDGPSGTGPFCACFPGFTCSEEVRDLGLSDPALSGSYCVPAN
jgi:hypothetical protein